MKVAFLYLCTFVFVCSSYAQTKTPESIETIRKIQSVKSSNTFLNAKAAFELYKRTNKSPLTAPVTAAPASNPRTYSFIWPQMKDGDNSIYFVSPITNVSSGAITLTDGDFIIWLKGCEAPGFYMLQINCSFQQAGTPEIKVIGSLPTAPYSYQEVASASMTVTAGQETNFVLGVNLTRGENIFRLNCLNNGKWNFYSLKIVPL
ncbi:MAG: hypothetical protein JST68_21735 [Bacteroidetes bacterium]|nr:hypothetical protein [Bacteroidota bacterium]